MKKTKEEKQASVEKKETVSQLEKLADRIEKMRLADYMTMVNRPTRIIWTNFLAGASRGIGFTVGAALIIAIVVKILMVLISMNIPYLSEQLQYVVEIIKSVPAKN